MELNFSSWALLMVMSTQCEPGSSVSIVSGYGLHEGAIEVQSR
jgi:hypothetical protein